MHRALFAVEKDGSRVGCGLCAHHCQLEEGEYGRCGVRLNREGRLYSLVYGRLVARHIDPVEKKPLFHVLPGSLSYSIATVGCNFSCLHCQNSSISQPGRIDPCHIPGEAVSPDQVVAAAMDGGCHSISYTYVEPTIFFEFARDCMVLGRERGLKNIFVSNGFMSEKAAGMAATCGLDAINIDIKSFRDEFYREICSARLPPVLETVKRMKALGVWVEVTTLLIPGLNDSDEELTKIAEFLVGVDPAIPWHVTGFYPTYRLTDRPPTPSSTLRRAVTIGQRTGLQYVYPGNAPGNGGENTLCPSCGSELISRSGFSVRANHLQAGGCPACGGSIPGIWV